MAEEKPKGPQYQQGQVNFDVDRFNQDDVRRARLEKELNELLYKATPGPRGTAQGAHVAPPSDIVVRQTGSAAQPGSVKPIVETTSDEVNKRVQNLRYEIGEIDKRQASPANAYPLDASSPAKRAYVLGGAGAFQMHPSLAQWDERTITALLAGDQGAGNPFSRFYNSIFDPDTARLQFMANEGKLGGAAKVITLDAAVGGGSFRPGEIRTTGNLLDYGRSTGFTNMADSPEVIRQRLYQLGQAVAQGQAEFGGQISKAARAADDAIALRQGAAKIGGYGTLAAAVGVGANEIMENRNNSAAALKAKADAAKLREKNLSKLSQRFFGAATQGFPGLTAAATAGDRGLSGAGAALWDDDVSKLFKLNRDRMFSGLEPSMAVQAGEQYAGVEDQYRDALRAMAMGQADISDYPELEEALTGLGASYGIDYGKTPYYYGSKKDGPEGDEFESGLMLQLEDVENPDKTKTKKMKRYGLKRGSNKLYDFADMDESMTNE